MSEYYYPSYPFFLGDDPYPVGDRETMKKYSNYLAEIFRQTCVNGDPRKAAIVCEEWIHSTNQFSVHTVKITEIADYNSGKFFDDAIKSGSTDMVRFLCKEGFISNFSQEKINEFLQSSDASIGEIILEYWGVNFKPAKKEES